MAEYGTCTHAIYNQGDPVRSVAAVVDQPPNNDHAYNTLGGGGVTRAEAQLRAAAQRGNTSLLSQLVREQKGLNLNATDGLGNTALHYSAHHDHPGLCTPLPPFILTPPPRGA
jgi:hypothetical protein